MRIDSHQHFWEYSPAEYGWIRPGSVLERSYLPSGLLPELTEANIDGCIAVQARQSLVENDFLLRLASENSFIRGVVGWIDLQSDSASLQASEFASNDKAVGVRHVVQDESDPDFMKRPSFRRGISKLAKLGLVYDILVYWNQLDDAIALARDFPDQIFVLDHIAKPAIAKGILEPWRARVNTLAGLPNVCCKVSGMITEADHTNWTQEDLSPFFDVVLEAFGPSRLLFGSDWPVIKLAGEYQRFLSVVENLAAPLSQSEKAALMGLNADRIYQL